MPLKRTIPRTCEQCGKAFLARPSQVAKGKAKYCCHRCYGDSLKGMRPVCLRDRENGIMRGGYVCIYMPSHPFAGKQGYVREHRLVMEQYLGRLLTPGEEVHHGPRGKTCNEIDNLTLTSSHAEHMHLHRFSLSDKWARNHKCCVACGTTAVRHEARGLCLKCYERQRVRRRVA